MSKKILALSLFAGLFIITTAFSFDQSSKKKWKRLFDGKTLQGWHTIPGGEWKIEDGTIVGLSDKADPRHGLLVTDQSFKDFEIRIKYKAIKGNSGLYFRSEQVG